MDHGLWFYRDMDMAYNTLQGFLVLELSYTIRMSRNEKNGKKMMKLTR